MSVCPAVEGPAPLGELRRPARLVAQKRERVALRDQHGVGVRPIEDLAGDGLRCPALAKQQALPPAAYGSAWPVPSTPAASRTPPPTASAGPAAATKSPRQKVSTADRPAPVPSASGRAGACAPADIVLSLFTSQSSYATGERPKFSVYAVSTSGAPCTLPYGAGSVQVVVTRHGHVVWDSAACEHSAVKPVQFTPGVPQLLTMVWNPTATEPAGCAGSLPAGTSGALDAVAMSDGQSSSVRTFKVGGLTA